MGTIIQASVKDTELIVSLGSRSLVESHGRSAPAAVMQSYLDEKFTAAVLEQELADPHNIFSIIYHNGKTAGFSKIIYRQPLEHIAKKRLTKMERLYLLEEFYDLGLGQQLFQHNIDLSKREGEEGMWLYVWKENERALRFYTRAGFRIVGDGFFRLTDEHANPNWQMLMEYGG